LEGAHFGGSDIVLSHVSGLLASRLDRPGSPLYCVSYDPRRRTLACLVSRDNGRSWSDCAAADRQFAAAYAIGGAHTITPGGYIIGSFTESIERGGHGKGVWFYRIKVHE